MFFSEFFLAKSGELSKYWLAAHMKIKKQDVKNTDIKNEIEFIKNPKVPLALRTTGHLLVGVARIYSSKLALLEKEARILIMKLDKTPYAVSLVGAITIAKPTKGIPTTVAKFNNITLNPKQTEIDLLFHLPTDMEVSSTAQFINMIDQITKQDVEGYDGWHIVKETQPSIQSLPMAIAGPSEILRPRPSEIEKILPGEEFMINEPVDLAGAEGLELGLPEVGERIPGHEAREQEEEEEAAFIPQADFGEEEEHEKFAPVEIEEKAEGVEGEEKPEEKKRGIKRTRQFAQILVDEETDIPVDSLRTTAGVVRPKELAPKSTIDAKIVEREPEDFDEFQRQPTSYEDTLPPQIMELWDDVLGKARTITEEEQRATKRRRKETDADKRKREISEEEQKRRETEEERRRRESEEEEAAFIPPTVDEDFVGAPEIAGEEFRAGEEKISGIGVDDIEQMFLQRRASSMRKSEEGKISEEHLPEARVSEENYLDQAKKELDKEELKLSEKYKGTGITDKTIKCFMVLEEALKEKEKVSLGNLLAGRKRETAAKFFFECLVMKGKKLIDVQQEDPEEEIYLGKPNTF